MDTKVVLIVALIVAGAILFATTTKSDSTKEKPARKWVSADEIALTANAIIGELDEEAVEALPSDLKSNTEGLALTDEEKTELFAILNSVTDSGVLGALGSASPLGASAMKNLVKTKNGILQNIRRYEKRMENMKKVLAKTKHPVKKAKFATEIKEAQLVVSRNNAALKNTIKEIERLKVEHKEEKKKVVVGRGSTAKMTSLISQAKRLRVKYTALEKTLAKLNKLAENAKKKSKTGKIPVTIARKLEKKHKATKKAMDSVRKSGRMIEGKIKAEKRRIAAVKKQSLAKARETKRAHEKEVAAKKLLEESEKKAAEKEAGVKKAKSVSKRKALEATRRAQKAQKMALAQKAHNEKVAEADNARKQYEEARAKKEAGALAKKKADLKRQKDRLRFEAARAKEAMKDTRQKIRQREDATKANVKAADAKQLEKAAQASKRANNIKSEGMRKQRQAAIREKASDEQKKRHEAAKKMAAMAVQRQKSLREKERRLEEKFQKAAADIRRKEQDIARREEMEKAEAKDQAEKAAQVAADQKQRELDQNKRDQQARALKQKQLALERKKEADQAKAVAALEKAKRDVAAKKAESAKKRREHMEARARLRKHKAQEAEKARKKQNAELEEGIEKISGMSSDSIDLFGLDKTVLLELKVLIEASGGHRILPAVIKMIQLKSNKEEEEEEVDDDSDDDDEDGPMTREERQKKYRMDFYTNVQRITGIIPDGPESFVVLDMEVLEELLAYAKTVTTGRLATFSEFVEEIIFSKKLITVAKQNGVTMAHTMDPRRMGWDSADIAGLAKIIEFLLESSTEMKNRNDILQMVRDIHRWKLAKIVAEREAAEEARAKKQAEELEAIEKARVIQAEKDLANDAAKLEQEKQNLHTEIVRVDKAVSAEKQQVAAEHQKEVETIAREHEKEKQVVVEEIKQELKEVEEEIAVETREKIEEVEHSAESKLVEMKQEQAEVENEQRAEAIEVVATIEAEISNTQDQAVVEALQQNLQEQKISQARVLDETAKAHALEQQAVVEEAKALKEEIKKSAVSEIEEKKTVAQENLESAVATIEQEKQGLIEAKEKVQEIEVEKVDLEGAIQTDLLEQQRHDVEEDKEIVEDTTVDDIVEHTVHPRASKEDRVTVSRKHNPNGSSFIKISVPSDMAPGESDTVSIFLSKEAGELLAQYHDIYKKIGEGGSLEDVSAEDKKVLASAGAEFKRIREQYVQQRKEKVLARREQLTFRMTN